MFDFHKDKRRYFEIQYLTTREYIIPFIDHFTDMESIGTVLEIGCGEAGVLRAFREINCNCTGIELSEARTAHARRFHSEFEAPGDIRFVNKNIYDIDVDRDIGHRFDLIILKDVIEHIHDQQRFIPRLQEFLTPQGVVFFGFPPWYMPFGGHQQVCRSPVLSKLPYFHLLPRPLYQLVLKAFGESDTSRRNLQEIKDTGISIERFERIIHASKFAIAGRKMWLLNPIYKYKFGHGPIAQIKLVENLPFIRNVVTTAAYYVIRPSTD